MNSEKSNNTCPQCGLPVPPEAPHGLCPKCVLAGADNLSEMGQPSLAPGDAPSPERVAGAFPQLEIVELAGRGGMGFVFKSPQVRLDRFVALKLLPDALANDPHFAERFNREGRVLARLNHLNIVSVYDFGIAKLIGPGHTEVTLTGTGATLGTPHYMAPEQLEKPSDVDHRGQRYSGRVEAPHRRVGVTPEAELERGVTGSLLLADLERGVHSAAVSGLSMSWPTWSAEFIPQNFPTPPGVCP